MNAQKKVAYLIGAGASHGSVKSVGCSRGILMNDLRQPFVDAVHDLVYSKPRKYGVLRGLVNDVIHNEVDFEHIITFLDESPSAIHRQFAEELRQVFAKVLKKELDEIKRDIGNERFALYSALLDMYQIEECPEILRGILSINYDEYIEDAAKVVCGKAVNYGFGVQNMENAKYSLLLLKLHGSFNWKDSWPIEVTGRRIKNPLLIPPGIQKAKNRYPFNVLWGLARDVLDCDVLRVIGCRLSGNDWDLISLLFSTRNVHGISTRPYVIEVIDSPKRAFQLKEQYPYLEVRSVFELEDQDIGGYFISELLGGHPRAFEDLDDIDLKKAFTRNYDGINWFHLWLKQKAEAFERDPEIPSTNTKSGQFQKLLEV